MVFFALDEAGLYLQATTSFVWSFVGETPIVRADPGRKQTHSFLWGAQSNERAVNRVAFRRDEQRSHSTLSRDTFGQHFRRCAGRGFPGSRSLASW
jgi:hypothetical protein